MTSSQLDRLINKWSLQVEDREKLFLYQATQVNDWDDTLIENSEKVRNFNLPALYNFVLQC